jgi:hypothetical protein
VFSYDRRGHGDSGDVRPYAVEREAEDLNAVIMVAGGSAAVFGGSSGAGLAARAAASPAWTRRAGEAVAGAIPGAVHRVLEGQVHYVAPEAIVPELLEFLITS